MFATLSARLFASLDSQRREVLGRRIALREQVVRKAGKDAHHHLANGFLYGARINENDRAALTRIASSGDRAIRVLGRFHDLQEAARCNALHAA
jgi:hypothetical protein